MFDTVIENDNTHIDMPFLVLHEKYSNFNPEDILD